MRIIIFLLISFIHISTWASDCSVDKPDLSIYYGNGMLNDRTDVIESQGMLQELLAGQFSGYRVNYKVSYNHNENLIEQILEVARQKLLQDYSRIFMWLAGIETAPDWFQEVLEEIVISYDAFSYILDGDLQRHIEDYTRDMNQCRKVLLVAHSQGNFYGNEAWRYVYQHSANNIPLNQLKLMGMVSVATPASQVGYPLAYAEDQEAVTRYLTLSEDFVINILRSVFFGPLPANVTNSTESEDWKNHSFILAYLFGDPSSYVLREQIKSVAYNLETLPFKREPLESSALASAGYDPTAQILEIQFVGSDSLYRYYDVPERIYRELISAESIGRYYNQVVRGQYLSRKLN